MTRGCRKARSAAVLAASAGVPAGDAAADTSTTSFALRASVIASYSVSSSYQFSLVATMTAVLDLPPAGAGSRASRRRCLRLERSTAPPKDCQPACQLLLVLVMVFVSRAGVGMSCCSQNSSVPLSVVVENWARMLMRTLQANCINASEKWKRRVRHSLRRYRHPCTATCVHRTHPAGE